MLDTIERMRNVRGQGLEDSYDRNSQYLACSMYLTNIKDSEYLLNCLALHATLDMAVQTIIMVKTGLASTSTYAVNIKDSGYYQN